MNIEAIDAAMNAAQRLRRDEISDEISRRRESFHAPASTFESRRADIAAVMELGQELGNMRRQIEYDLRRAAVKA